MACWILPNDYGGPNMLRRRTSSGSHLHHGRHEPPKRSYWSNQLTSLLLMLTNATSSTRELDNGNRSCRYHDIFVLAKTDLLRCNSFDHIIFSPGFSRRRSVAATQTSTVTEPASERAVRRVMIESRPVPQLRWSSCGWRYARPLRSGDRRDGAPGTELITYGLTTITGFMWPDLRILGRQTVKRPTPPTRPNEDDNISLPFGQEDYPCAQRLRPARSSVPKVPGY